MVSVNPVLMRVCNKRTGYNTVNGVNMMMLQKMRKDIVKKGNVTGRNSPRGRKKKIVKEAPSSEKI